MSGPELATKAPESDALEDTAPDTNTTTLHPSAIPTNEPSNQSDSSPCIHCTTDRPLLNTTIRPSGIITKLNDISTYISKPSSYPSSPAPLLLLLTGGTGIHSTNNQIQADRYASQGYVVIMPDQFDNDPAPGTNTTVTSPHSETPSLIENIKLKAVETAKSFMIDMWLARQTAEKVLPRIHKVLDAVREEYADCIAHRGGIYAAGYCVGGKYVLVLASSGGIAGTDNGEDEGQAVKGESQRDDEEKALATREPLIKAGVVAHAAQVTREDVRNVLAPISLVAVEKDPLFPQEILDIGRKAMAASRVEHEIRVYEGVPHGFAVVGEYEDPKIKEAQEKAWEQMMGWLRKH